MLLGVASGAGKLDETISSSDADAIERAPMSAPAEGNSSAPLVIANRYELLGLIGEGGMGSVYRVRDRDLDEIVALKFLRRELVSSPSMAELFRQEAKLARRVTHTNVARTFDVGDHQGERFLTMEFVDGESLAALIAREAPLPLPRVVDLSVSLCAALDAAHAAGVVHRDLKPDNVLIERGGRVVITDFGIARARGGPNEGSIVGTPGYMAPEQLAGSDDVDGRADFYALGAVLFEMLVAEPAWAGGDVKAIVRRRLSERVPDLRTKDPTIPHTLAALVARCMATRPEDRYADAGEIAKALRLVAVGSSAYARAPTMLASAPVVPPLLAERGDRTVAVLPFRNAGAPDDEYLAEELTDDLVDSLSSARGLRVRPRRMITREIAAESDIRVIGRALDVQVIVEGTVRRRDGAVRVSARAIAVAEGLQLWAKRFDRPANEVLAVNDEVARAVVEALCAEREAPSRHAPSDPEAVDLLLRARQALRRAWMGQRDLGECTDLFERGLRRAPEDPELLSGYAMALARRLNYSGAHSCGPDDARNARAAAERAATIAPHLGEPWLALATLEYTTSDWIRASSALRTALDRAPSLQRAHEMLASIEIETGDVDAGLARLLGVLALDPTSEVAHSEAVRTLALLGRFDEVEALLARSAKHFGDSPLRAMFDARIDLWRGVVREAPSTAAYVDSSPMTQLMHTYREVAATRSVRPEMTASFARAADATRADSRLRPLMFQFQAELLGFVGDRAHTLRMLERAVDARLYDLLWLDRCPAIACVRDDEAFAALRTRVASSAGAIRDALHVAHPVR